VISYKTGLKVLLIRLIDKVYITVWEYNHDSILNRNIDTINTIGSVYKVVAKLNVNNDVLLLNHTIF